MTAWELRESEFWASKYKKYQKKQPIELEAMLLNLQTCVASLNDGRKPRELQAGFIHREPQGVTAIDQRGAPGRPKQMRLYIYPDEDTSIVWQITIGDKSKHGQKQDLADCRKFMKHLLKDG